MEFLIALDQDVDPTTNCLVDEAHVTLGSGRDFSDVPPLRGVILGGDDQELKVAVTVLPLDDLAVVDSAPISPL